MRFPRSSSGGVPESRLGSVLVVAVGFTLGVLGFALYHAARGPVQTSPFPETRLRSTAPTRPRIHIGPGRGIRLMEVGEQGVFYSLEVDRVGFEPAAVGFFRVGFLHSVLLENVRLTVRADPGAFRRSNPADAVESALASLLEQRELAAPEWFGGFTGASATLLHIRVLQDDQEALALSSQRASVDVRRRQLDLQGQVRVAVDGGAKVLESDALHLSLETLQFWTNGEVRLQVGGQRHRSVGFRSDVFLAEVGGQPEDQVGQQIRRGQMRDWGPEERGS